MHGRYDAPLEKILDRFGRTLVRGRNDELFVPGMSGRIESNDKLRSLTADGASVVASSSEGTTTRGPVTIQNHWMINGADDPRAVADQIDARFSILMRQLESEQRGLLSD